MLLKLSNLPVHMRIPDVRQLIQMKCGLSDIILDNLAFDGQSGMKVTVGIADETDADILMSSLNGLFMDGKQLHVEDVRKNKAKKEEPYYGSRSIPAPPLPPGMLPKPQEQSSSSGIGSEAGHMAQVAYPAYYMQGQPGYQNSFMGYGSHSSQYTGGGSSQYEGNQQSQLGFAPLPIESQSHDLGDNDRNSGSYDNRRESPQRSGNRDKRDRDLYDRDRYRNDRGRDRPARSPEPGPNSRSRQHDRSERYGQSESGQGRSRSDNYRESEPWRKNNDDTPPSKRQRFDHDESQPYERRPRFDEPPRSFEGSTRDSYQSTQTFQQKSSRDDYDQRPKASFQQGRPKSRFEPTASGFVREERQQGPRFEPESDRNPGSFRDEYQQRPTSKYQPGPSSSRSEPEPSEFRYQSRPTNSGYEGRSTNSGYDARPTNSGYDGRPSNSGYEPRPSNSGPRASTSKFDHQPSNPKIQQRAPNPRQPQFQPRPPNPQAQTRPQNPKFQPKAPNPRFQTRPTNPKFQARNADIQPRPSAPKQPKFILANPKPAPSTKPKIIPLKTVTTWINMSVGELSKELTATLVLPIDMVLYAKCLKNIIRKRLQDLYLTRQPQTLPDVKVDYRKAYPKETDKALMDDAMEQAVIKEQEQAEIRKRTEENQKKLAAIMQSKADGKTEDVKVEAAASAPNGSTDKPNVQATTVQATLPKANPPKATTPKATPPKATLEMPKLRPPVIPKAKGAVKSEMKLMKRQNKMVFENEMLITSSLDVTTRRALDEEVEAILQKFIQVCKESDLGPQAVAQRIIKEVVPDFGTVLKINISKRLLCHPTTVRVFCSPRLVPRAVIEPFLRGKGVSVVKKSARKPMYLATVASHDLMDWLCVQEPMKCGDSTITFAPLQMVGPPKKVKRSEIKQQRKNLIKSQQISGGTCLDFEKDTEEGEFFDDNEDFEGEYEEFDETGEDIDNDAFEVQNNEDFTEDVIDDIENLDTDPKEPTDDAKDTETNDTDSNLNESNVSFNAEDIDIISAALTADENATKDREAAEVAEVAKEKAVESNADHVNTETVNNDSTGKDVGETTKDDSADVQAESTVDQPQVVEKPEANVDNTAADKDVADVVNPADIEIGDVDEDDLEDW